jgi:N-methylhydantoinase B
MPAEICEARYPLLVDRFTFNLTLAGAGRYRGGLGLVRDYRLLCEKAELTTTFGRHHYPPWGGAGGEEGSPNGVAVIPVGKDEPVVWRGKLARYPLRRGDVARLVTSVGGGYGDPLSRDLAFVRQDVRDELLTVADARRLYGVVLDSTSLVVDGAATAALRQELAGKRRDHSAQPHKI